jgi:ketosteroid isomerase-like protein
MMSDAVAVATKFFDAHRAHDIYAMSEMCSPNAKFDYVPFVGHDKQRVVTGSGYVNGVGRTIWALGFRAFGDLTNTVHDVFADGDGNVVAEVTVSGTQSGPYLTLAPRGQSFSGRQLFRLHVDADGRIDDIAAYYDACGMNGQLGHVELD